MVRNCLIDCVPGDGPPLYRGDNKLIIFFFWILKQAGLAGDLGVSSGGVFQGYKKRGEKKKNLKTII